MREAGYSGTPLLKKLGAKEGMAALLIAVPDEIEPLANFDGWGKCKRAKTLRSAAGGPYDYIHLFAKDAEALREATPKMKGALAEPGMIWVSWPKKSSGVATTITEDVIRALALKNGLVDIKVCAIDDTWSGLKLVIPRKDRRK